MSGGVGFEPRPYPTDEFGFAYHPKELGLFDFTTGETKNNHHLNYFARDFGRLAISKTFRDLETQQVQMPISEHDKLHRLFTGIQVPQLPFMLTAIEVAREQGRKMKIYIPGQGYVYNPITAVHFNTLLAEYNEVNRE
jgi:hypothetical protein